VRLLAAFLVGGGICTVAQLIVDLTNCNPAVVMVGSVSAGAILSGLGVYEALVEIGGAGATVPLPGFGHALVQGMMEEAARSGPIGVLTGGLKATSLGLSAAIILGYLAALLFDPKG
jgi:stage V sporulation protein AE